MNEVKNSRLYEGMYILSATLSEDSRKKAFEKITEGIESRSGKIHKIHEQGRKKLAYAIGKKKEGYYFLVYFSIPAEAVKELWEDYALHEDLIRFITLQAEEVKETIEFKPLINSIK